MTQLDSDVDRYMAKLTQAVIAGLDDGGALFEQAAERNARQQMHGQTGATFAGIYAAVDGPSSSAIVAQAVAAVSERNPAHVSTEASEQTLDAVIRMVGSVPTDYIDLLEARPDKRFLSTTLDETGSEIMRAVESAVGRVV